MRAGRKSGVARTRTQAPRPGRDDSGFSGSTLDPFEAVRVVNWPAVRDHTIHAHGGAGSPVVQHLVSRQRSKSSFGRARVFFAGDPRSKLQSRIARDAPFTIPVRTSSSNVGHDIAPGQSRHTRATRSPSPPIATLERRTPA